MFFVLSKTVSFLAMPLPVIFMLILLSWWLKNPRWKKILRVTAIAMLFFFSNDFIGNEVMRWWELPPTAFKDMKPHKLGIVLTGSTLPFQQPNDRVYFSRGADRVTHTVQLYKLGLIEKILISGGSGMLVDEVEPEANKFKRAMVMMGVDSSAIIIENATRNTYESAVAVKPMLDSLGYRAEDCLLITSAFHMRRSLACYRKAGVNLESFTTDFYSHPRKFYPDALLIPKPEVLALWHKLVKEWVGLAAYKIAGYV